MSQQPVGRKLIEVALPLATINHEAAREKSIRHGHPSTLHLWFARRPLAACRAVLFAQLVDDPSARPEEFPTEEEQDAERARLFDLIERLVPWEASTNKEVLAEAHAEIKKCFPDGIPPVLDPFAGGGSIPLEAQRLGLEAHASDLNPVAVLINKALIEFPPILAGQPPVNPGAASRPVGWEGAQGLADDVRFYGAWMRERAQERIGHLYPKARLPDGGEATVIAWIWARTVTCPNPACRATMPLVRSFWLGKKKGKEAFVVPEVVDGGVRFGIGHGAAGPVEGTVGRTGARCLVCDASVPLTHVRAEGKAGRMGAQLMAVAAEGHRQRVYLPPTDEHVAAADVPVPEDVPQTDVATNPRWFSPPFYGMTKHADLFTRRQLATLTTLCDLIGEVREQVELDSQVSGGPDDEPSRGEPLDRAAYADAVVTYLAFAFSGLTANSSSLTTWVPATSKEGTRGVFSRNAIGMAWDFAKANPLNPGPAEVSTGAEWVAKVVERLSGPKGIARQADATDKHLGQPVVSTDPPYYDNVGYADLSDFFYIWLRRALKSIYPELLQTLLTPKARELVADPYRHGGSDQAETFFEDGFFSAFRFFRGPASDDLPMTVYYAFKQSETERDTGQTASTGWETMLEGMLRSGWAVTGTWPMRTERGGRMNSIQTNSLASSIVLVCRPRRTDAGVTDRRGFQFALGAALPNALRELQQGLIAPVDLAQASIGPGMAVFSSYAKVVESDGTPMTVRTALGLINAALDEVLAEQEGEFDPETRWAVKWFEQHGYDDGPYGEAETLSTALAVSVAGMERGGLLRQARGSVHLLGTEDLPEGWDPATDERVTTWEVVHHLIKRLDEHGEAAAGQLLASVGGLAEPARDLAYRLFALAERTKRQSSALAFNRLVTSWPDLARSATGSGTLQESTQLGLL